MPWRSKKLYDAVEWDGVDETVDRIVDLLNVDVYRSQVSDRLILRRRDGSLREIERGNWVVATRGGEGFLEYTRDGFHEDFEWLYEEPGA